MTGVINGVMALHELLAKAWVDEQQSHFEFVFRME
jgi:hypothetical protein